MAEQQVNGVARVQLLLIGGGVKILKAKITLNLYEQASKDAMSE